MANKLNINFIINNVMFTIDDHFKEMSITPRMKEYLYLVATGMILNYGYEYIKDIYDTIFNTRYYKKSKNVIDTLYYENPVVNNYLEKEVNIKNSHNDYSILWEEIDNSPIKTLEFLTYQMNYIMFNKHRNNRKNDIIKVKFSPINLNFLFKRDKQDNILEQVFCVIQSEEIIKNILKLNINVIKNKRFNKILLELQDVDINTYQIEGLNILANLFRPLYKDDKLKDIIDSYDNIELIKKELDTVLGKNTYKNTYKQLVTINKLINTKEVKNYYELANYFVDIRNNVINKYIRLKWA